MNSGQLNFPSPNITVAVEAIKKDEEEKLSQALHQLKEEDSNAYC